MNRIYKYQIQNREYVSFKNQVPNQELEHITFMKDFKPLLKLNDFRILNLE